MATYNETMAGGAVGGGVSFLPDPQVIYTAFARLDLTLYKLSFRSQRVPPVTFRIFQEGRLVKTIDSASGSASLTLTIGIGETPFIEVLDQPNMVPYPAFSEDLTLHWREMAGAASYQVQQYNGSSWDTLRTIPDDPDQENYSFVTAPLEDVTTYQFQVVPLDSTGAAGTPVGFTVEQVRTPDIPKVSYEYGGASSPTLTINSA
jgi:hypothetical protein